jgi:hypothetical protein
MGKDVGKRMEDKKDIKHRRKNNNRKLEQEALNIVSVWSKE